MQVHIYHDMHTEVKRQLLVLIHAFYIACNRVSLQFCHRVFLLFQSHSRWLGFKIDVTGPGFP